MLAVLIANLSAVIITLAFWNLDQRVLKCHTQTRLWFAIIPLSISVWLIILIHLALWLQVPGAYGPVQYWTDSPGGGQDFVRIRVLAFLLLFGTSLAVLATPIVLIRSLLQRSGGSRWRRCVIPTITFGLYAFAFYSFFVYEFFPTA
jgi:hypothetical protein